jgi:hypothetical protein
MLFLLVVVVFQVSTMVAQTPPQPMVLIPPSTVM